MTPQSLAAVSVCGGHMKEGFPCSGSTESAGLGGLEPEVQARALARMHPVFVTLPPLAPRDR